jgi:hypothetical protein
MRSSVGRIVCFLALLAACGPSSDSEPEGRPYVVQGASPAEVAEHAARLERVSSAMRELVPGLDVRAVELSVVEALPPRVRGTGVGVVGQAMPHAGRIEVVRAGGPLAETTLAHELFHVWSDATWRAAPSALLEGLADVIAGRVCPAQAAALRSQRLTELLLGTGGSHALVVVFLPAPDALQLTFPLNHHEDVGQLPSVIDDGFFGSDDSVGSHAAGFLLAERIVDRLGLQGTYEWLGTLCSSPGGITTRELLDMAGLPAETADWRGPARAAFTLPELHALAVRLRDRIVDGLVIECTPLFPGATAQAGRAGARPIFKLEDGVAIDLVTVDGLPEAFTAAWDARARD